MSKSLNATVKISFTPENEKQKWKKMRIKMNERDFKVCEYFDITRVFSQTINLQNYDATEYPKEYAIYFTDNNSSSFYIRFEEKNYDSWLRQITRSVKSIKTSEASLLFSRKASETINESEVMDLESFLSQSPSVGGSVPSSRQATPVVLPPKGTRSTEPAKSPRTSLSISEKIKIKYFGGNIKKIYKAYGDKFPIIFENIIERIESAGIDVPGIYRESGNSSDISKLKILINKGSFSLDDPLCEDVHVLTGILKSFFRELKHKVMSHELVDIYSSFEGSEKITQVRLELEKLPLAHRSVIYRMIQHLTRIKENSNKNKMDFYNLSVVFGPTLVECEAMEMYKGVDLVKFICNNQNALFSTLFMSNLIPTLHSTSNIVKSNENTPKVRMELSRELGIKLHRRNVKSSYDQPDSNNNTPDSSYLQQDLMYSSQKYIISRKEPPTKDSIIDRKLSSTPNHLNAAIISDIKRLSLVNESKFKH